MTNEKQTEKVCKVKDLFAKSTSRIHELADANGRRINVEFPVDKYVELPLTLALPLVGNNGFEVIGPDGKILKPARARGAETLTLDYDQTIARYSELTIEALIERARPLPGGDKLSRKDGKDAIINFILEAGTQPESDVVAQVGGNWLPRPSGQALPPAA